MAWPVDLSCGHLDVESPEFFVVHLGFLHVFLMVGEFLKGLINLCLLMFIVSGLLGRDLAHKSVCFLSGRFLFLNVLTIIHAWVYIIHNYIYIHRSTQNEPTLNFRNQKPEGPEGSTIWDNSSNSKHHLESTVKSDLDSGKRSAIISLFIQSTTRGAL